MNDSLQKPIPQQIYRLPITVTERQPISFDKTDKVRPQLTIIGCAGVVGTVTHNLFSDRFDIKGLDTETQNHQGRSPWWTVGSLTDEEVLDEVIKDADYVLLAATGAKGGWEGLKNVEIEGTPAVCAASVRHRVKRLIVLSSNHSTGMNELDIWEGNNSSPASPSSPLRPDGLYGSAKIFAESVARSTSEIYGLPTSVIRLGAMRLHDTPSKTTDGPRHKFMTDAEYSSRMHSVWVSHKGWSNLLQEELSSEDQFRLRYGSDEYHQTPWTSDVMIWNSSKI